MRTMVLAAATSLVAALAAASPAAAITAQSKACWAKADAQHIAKAERAGFHASCVKGALHPGGPTVPTGSTAWSHAVTAPSGETRDARSRRCSAEADKRGLTSSKREAFRLSCVASAAPAAATGTGTTPPAPSGAKDVIVQHPPQ